MQVVLIMFRSDGERRSFSLPRAITVIGRREDCDLRIPLADISRKHCRFIKENDTLRVEDLGSSNGTFHNGVRVQEAVVQAGDTVQVGPVAFVVQIDGVPADDEIQPAFPSHGNTNADTSVAPMPHDNSFAREPTVGGHDDEVVDLDLEEVQELDSVEELEEVNEIDEIDEIEEIEPEDDPRTRG